MNSTKKVVAFTMAALAMHVVVTLMVPANASTEEEIIPPVQEVHVSETVEEPAKEEVKAPTKPPMTEAYKTEVEAESAAEFEAEEVPVTAEIPAVISPMVEEIADVISNEEIYMEEPATEEVNSNAEVETVEPTDETDITSITEGEPTETDDTSIIEAESTAADDISIIEEEIGETDLTGGMIWGVIDTDPVPFPAEEEVVWEEEIPDEPEEEVNELDASIANSVESLKGCVRIYSDGTEEQIYSDEYIADLAAIISVYGGDIVDYNNTVSYLNAENSEDLMSAMTLALFGEEAGQEEVEKAEEILGSYL